MKKRKGEGEQNGTRKLVYAWRPAFAALRFVLPVLSWFMVRYGCKIDAVWSEVSSYEERTGADLFGGSGRVGLEC